MEQQLQQLQQQLQQAQSQLNISQSRAFELVSQITSERDQARTATSNLEKILGQVAGILQVGEINVDQLMSTLQGLVGFKAETERRAGEAEEKPALGKHATRTKPKVVK